MRRSPHDNWRIEDVAAVCEAYGIILERPTGGSHYKVSHPGRMEILTIPARKPIKPVYIKLFILLVDDVTGGSR